jgi:AcrR family transcriptional regulator
VPSATPVAAPDARSRIETAALDLFEQQGYAATTVEAIASAAGVARRTFFLHFPSKDAVLFLHHEELSERVGAFLDSSGDAPAVPSMCDAVRMVFADYVEADPDIAVRRYRLVKDVPELRAREIAWVQRYRVLFGRYLHARLDQRPNGALEAEAMAGSFAAIHNHMLRRWLKGELSDEPMADLDDALRWLSSSFDVVLRDGGPRRMVVAVFEEGTDPSVIADEVERAMRPEVPAAAGAGPSKRPRTRR